ncbi:MAG: type II toxin-antitoxin system prevent-host-death family antitoxin [Kiritimatiellaeota bacterium]|nr:type II toxin-antitoxin system prevent-host-death family antitoxin [Kiritimatiellota bacterium]
MTTLTFTDFRRRASGVLSDVEKGAAFVIVRHGRPIAELSPVHANTAHGPMWKRPGLRLVSSGLNLSRAILDERDRA